MMQDHLSVSPEEKKRIEGVISRILAEISQQYNLELTQDQVAVNRIQEAVVNAWHVLRTETQAEINLPFISATTAGPIHYQLNLSKADFESSSSPLTEGDRDQRPIKSRIELPDRKPMVTTTLMVISGLIYLAQLLTNFLAGYDLPAALGVKANEWILAGEYWRFITPIFLHGSILHLGFNMYALHILGRRLERFYGSARFFGLYLIGGITGNLFSFLFTISPSLGSSTAIFGLLGAEGVFIYQHRKLFGDQFKVALRQIIQVAVINLLIGLSPGIDNWGHVGGLLGGMVFSWFAGPIFELQGEPPVFSLKDIRPENKSGSVFLLNLLFLISLVAVIIYFRLR